MQLLIPKHHIDTWFEISVIRIGIGVCRYVSVPVRPSPNTTDIAVQREIAYVSCYIMVRPICNNGIGPLWSKLRPIRNGSIAVSVICRAKFLKIHISGYRYATTDAPEPATNSDKSNMIKVYLQFQNREKKKG